VELEASYRSKADDLEAEHRQKLEGLEQKRLRDLEEMAIREKALQDKSAEFNTREAKYVSRTLVDDLKRLLDDQEIKELTTRTKDKRDIVHRIIAVLVAASGTMAGFMIHRIFSLESPPWELFVSLAASTATCITTLVYYLKWNDRWFREHADAEMSARRYKADLIRASWVAELASDWSERLQKEAPASLIDACVRNLFIGTAASAESQHPLEAFGDLLKNVEEIKIGKKGIGIKRLLVSKSE
jgi:hypothetical protein